MSEAQKNAVSIPSVETARQAVIASNGQRSHVDALILAVQQAAHPKEPMNLRLFHDDAKARWFLRDGCIGGHGDTPEAAMRDYVLVWNSDAETPDERLPVQQAAQAPSDAYVLTVLKNSGVDVDCGACMEVAFTGVTTNAHACKSALPTCATCQQLKATNAELDAVLCQFNAQDVADAFVRVRQNQPVERTTP